MDECFTFVFTWDGVERNRSTFPLKLLPDNSPLLNSIKDIGDNTIIIKEDEEDESFTFDSGDWIIIRKCLEDEIPLNECDTRILELYDKYIEATLMYKTREYLDKEYERKINACLSKIRDLETGKTDVIYVSNAEEYLSISKMLIELQISNIVSCQLTSVGNIVKMFCCDHMMYMFEPGDKIVSLSSIRELVETSLEKARLQSNNSVENINNNSAENINSAAVHTDTNASIDNINTVSDINANKINNSNSVENVNNIINKLNSEVLNVINGINNNINKSKDALDEIAKNIADIDDSEEPLGESDSRRNRKLNESLSSLYRGKNMSKERIAADYVLFITNIILSYKLKQDFCVDEYDDSEINKVLSYIPALAYLQSGSNINRSLMDLSKIQNKFTKMSTIDIPYIIRTPGIGYINATKFHLGFIKV